jgi:hypothetical protein
MQILKTKKAAICGRLFLNRHCVFSYNLGFESAEDLNLFDVAE